MANIRGGLVFHKEQRGLSMTMTMMVVRNMLTWIIVLDTSHFTLESKN